MKIGAITNAFNCARWIDGCVRQFVGLDIDHMILCNHLSWNGNIDWDMNTVKLALQSGADVKFGFWKSAQDQFNWGLRWFEDRGYDWVMLVDADERWTARDLSILMRELAVTDREVVRAAKHLVYWKTPEYRIDPPPTDIPFVAFRPHVRVRNIRWPGSMQPLWSRALMHHLSYVRTDEEMLAKLTVNDDYRGRNRAALEWWYEERWLGWTPELEDLHPTHPSQFKRAIYDPAPAEIIGLL